LPYPRPGGRRIVHRQRHVRSLPCTVTKSLVQGRALASTIALVGEFLTLGTGFSYG
jgi:hypothetical protein